MKASLKDRWTWLYDLVHDDMEPDTVTKGYIKFYALQGLAVDHVQRDIHSRVSRESLRVDGAMERLRSALEAAVDAPDRSEMRTLEEVRMIVDAVRAGERVAVEYYDPDMGDNPYIAHQCW